VQPFGYKRCSCLVPIVRKCSAAMVKREEARKYKYIYFHKTSRLWQAVRRGYPTICHVSQDQAACSTAKAWKLRRSTLELHDISKSEPSQEERKYKFIYFHSASLMWQSVRRGFKSVAHSDQDHCAWLAARSWGQSRSDLKLQVRERDDTVPMQKFRHVTWHSSKKVWVVQVASGSEYVGCSSNMLKAVDIACKVLKCKRQALELSTRRRACSTSTDLCKRFAVMMKVFAGVRCTDPPMVPADFAHLMVKAGAKKKDRVIEGGAGVAFPFIISKFPAHRDAIERSTSGAGKCAEDKLYNRLVAASEKMSGHALNKALVRNIGRKNMHHGTFVMFASKGLGLLRRVKGAIKKPTSATKCLKFGTEGRYEVKDMSKILKLKLTAMIGFDAALAATKPPRTITDWRRELDRLQKVMLGPPQMPGCSGAYRGVWAIRCGLIYLMRRAGINKLELEGCTVRDFLGNFPDQKQQVLAVAGGKHMVHRLMQDVLSDTGYVAPPELFTMYACLFADSSVQKLSTAWLVENSAMLRSKCLSYFKEHGFPPHPGVLIEMVRSGE
jgi:hypothetical protein